MKHLFISREYPPGPCGGIGTYTHSITRALAERGERVHIITQLWEGAKKLIEEFYSGRLVVHRLPFDSWTSFSRQPCKEMPSGPTRALFCSDYPPQSFSWSAALLAERLVREDGIDFIEGADYEAPLYYFQLRRALGKGPERVPPCIVHLHSPTEFIGSHNGWNAGDPAYLAATRLETYSIGAAEALLCPSRYLARQLEVRYKLSSNSIQVIPYPIVDGEKLERNDVVWKQGPICYLGRLEPRKGVLEWIRAAIEVADSFPCAKFDFVGRNVLGHDRLSSHQILERLVPSRLRNRFSFLGERPREGISSILAGARLGVVPSRWENFPYACIEQMMSGLPIIASPEGGMAEMIEDGLSGWIAKNAKTDGLVDALVRALRTPTAQLADMGSAAACGIRKICDADVVVDRHMRWRSELIAKDMPKSVTIPSVKSAVTPENDGSIALIVTSKYCGKALRKCLQSIEFQRKVPELVIVAKSAEANARTNALNKILHSSVRPIGVAFLTEKDRLNPGFVSSCEAALRLFPKVGLVSFWVSDRLDGDMIEVGCNPAFPFQWIANGATSASVVRTQALREVGGFRAFSEEEYETWDMFNAVLHAGWKGITLPEVLAIRKGTRGRNWLAAGVRHRTEIRRRLFERLGPSSLSTVVEIGFVAKFEEHVALTARRARLRYLRNAQLLLTQPLETAQWILRQFRLLQSDVTKRSLAGRSILKKSKTLAEPNRPQRATTNDLVERQ